MKAIVRINPKTLKEESFPHLEPGPVPPIIDPEKPEEAKDGGAPTAKPEQKKYEKPKPN